MKIHLAVGWDLSNDDVYYQLPAKVDVADGGHRDRESVRQALDAAVADLKTALEEALDLPGNDRPAILARLDQRLAPTGFARGASGSPPTVYVWYRGEWHCLHRHELLKDGERFVVTLQTPRGELRAEYTVGWSDEH